MKHSRQKSEKYSAAKEFKAFFQIKIKEYGYWCKGSRIFGSYTLLGNILGL